MTRPSALDLFSGAGGLSQGLRQAGFSVIGAVDNEPLAVKAYRLNHPQTRVWLRDIRRLSPLAVADELGLAPGDLDLLAGCPPCQGFSTLRTKRQRPSVRDNRNDLVAQFARYVEALRPKALMMENVPGLAGDVRFARILTRLRRFGYQLTYDVLDANDYGVPQRRRRFVLLGAFGSHVLFAPPQRNRRSVRQAIGHLPDPGESTDPLHSHGETRSDEVRRRIEAIPPEAGLRQLGVDRQLACHLRTRGFYDIYGRMAWDGPAPTITGGCINPSKGRFLHPDQPRAITLREAALLQSFPARYRFPLDRGKYRVADLIGNALPPTFVRHQARQILRHLVAAEAA